MALETQEIEIRPGVTATIKVEKGGDASQYVTHVGPEAGATADADTKARAASKNKAASAS